MMSQMGGPAPYLMQPAIPLAPAPPYSLVQAIDMLSRKEVIAQLLKRDPNLVHERGFNGQTPLHRAVLVGSTEVVEMILQAGGDPNARNNHQETPLHFACKVPVCQKLHLLIKYGGDIDAVDQNGQGCLVHALSSGSMYVISYLLYKARVSRDVTDFNGLPPLHIVCSRAHIEAVLLLLNKEDANVYQQDAYGNTALHIAASMGYPKITWILIERGGWKLMDMQNRDGYTALDLAAAGTGLFQKQAHQLLSQYSHPNYKSPKVQGPVNVWYWHCVAPAVLYMAALIFCQMFPHKGFAMIGSLVALLLVANQQGHRIKHICAWANPMSAGMFAAGLVFTALCFLTQEASLVYESHSKLVALSIFGLILLFAMYLKLMIGDPGTIKHPYVNKATGEPYTLGDIAAQTLYNEQYCTSCQLTLPPRSKHCKLCMRCMADMDHHCLFLYKCIGKNNQRLFVRFITITILAMASFEYASFLTIQTLYPNQVLDFPLLMSVFNDCTMIWSLMVLNVLSMLWLLQNLAYQLDVVSKGQTLFFQTVVRSKLPLTIRIRNVYNFYVGKKLYAREDKDGVVIL